MSAEKSVLTVIFGPHNRSRLGDGKRVMAAFNEMGLIEETTLEEEFLELVGHEPDVVDEGTIGPFNGLEQIQKFSFNLCQKLGNKGASLVPMDDYNELLVASFKIEDFKQKLEEKGSFIDNPEAGKTGLFNKIFN